MRSEKKFFLRVSSSKRAFFRLLKGKKENDYGKTLFIYL